MLPPHFHCSVFQEGGGPHPAVLRTDSEVVRNAGRILCTQTSLLWGPGSYGMRRIKPRLLVCKASTLPAVLSPFPLLQILSAPPTPKPRAGGNPRGLPSPFLNPRPIFLRLLPTAPHWPLRGPRGSFLGWAQASPQLCCVVDTSTPDSSFGAFTNGIFGSSELCLSFLLLSCLQADLSLMKTEQSRAPRCSFCLYFHQTLSPSPSWMADGTALCQESFHSGRHSVPRS